MQIVSGTKVYQAYFAQSSLSIMKDQTFTIDRVELRTSCITGEEQIRFYTKCGLILNPLTCVKV